MIFVFFKRVENIRIFLKKISADLRIEKFPL